MDSTSEEDDEKQGQENHKDNETHAGGSEVTPAGVPMPPPTESPSASAQAAMTSFKNSTAVQDFLTKVVQGYKEARGHWDTATAELSRAKSNLAANKIGRGQIPTYVANARPPIIADAPMLFDSVTAKLKQCEQDGIKIILQARVDITQKTVDWYKNKINAQTLVATKQIEFVNTILTNYADKYDATFADVGADAKSKFPRRPIIAWMGSELLTRITNEFTRDVERQARDEQAKQDKIAEDLKAQETVMAGAHNGDTIRAVAAMAAREQIAIDKKKQQARRPQQPNRSDTNTPTQSMQMSLGHNKKPRGQQGQHKTQDQQDQQERHTGYKRQRSPDDDERPRHGQESPRRQRTAAADDAGRPRHRSDYSAPRRHDRYEGDSHQRRDPPPKNGVGGDKHNESSNRHHSDRSQQSDRHRHHSDSRDSRGGGASWHERKADQYSSRHH